MLRISKYICIAVILIWVFAGTFPVFGQVMKSDNYRLELEEGEIAPVEGFEGKTTTEKTDHPDFWKAILLIGVIVILLILFVFLVARNWSLKRKEKLKE